MSIQSYRDKYRHDALRSSVELWARYTIYERDPNLQYLQMAKSQAEWMTQALDELQRKSWEEIGRAIIATIEAPSRAKPAHARHYITPDGTMPNISTHPDTSKTRNLISFILKHIRISPNK